jgi:hypothetical protein
VSDRLPRPEPRDAFKRALRAQLMAQAPTVLSKAQPPLARRETAWSRFQVSFMKPALAVAAAVLILIAGAGKAAADSLPGDLAFGLKMAAEQLQLGLALDDSTRIKLLSEDADHRLAELTRAITTRPDAAPTATTEYAAAVARFTAAVDALRGKPDTSADKRTEVEDVIDAARAKHQAVLDELEKTAPADAQPGLERAREEADKLRPSGPPDRPKAPQPTRTQPARASETPRGGEPTRTPLPTRP